MIKSVVYSNRIKLYFDYVKGFQDDFTFEITLNDRVYKTNKFHYSFYNLNYDTEYNFSVVLKDNKGNLVLDLGNAKITTCKSKKFIDVTKPPYNAVGDGQTLNTLSLQNAINDCKVDELVFIPNGVYLTGALDLKSNTEIYLDDGEPAPICPKVKDLYFNDIKVTGIRYFTGQTRALIGDAIRIQGYEDDFTIDNVVLDNIKILKRNFVPYQTMAIKNVKNLKIGNVSYVEE